MREALLKRLVAVSGRDSSNSTALQMLVRTTMAMVGVPALVMTLSYTLFLDQLFTFHSAADKMLWAGARSSWDSTGREPSDRDGARAQVSLGCVRCSSSWSASSSLRFARTMPRRLPSQKKRANDAAVVLSESSRLCLMRGQGQLCAYRCCLLGRRGAGGSRACVCESVRQTRAYGKRNRRQDGMFSRV